MLTVNVLIIGTNEERKDFFKSMQGPVINIDPFSKLKPFVGFEVRDWSLDENTSFRFLDFDEKELDKILETESCQPSARDQLRGCDSVIFLADRSDIKATKFSLNEMFQLNGEKCKIYKGSDSNSINTLMRLLADEVIAEQKKALDEYNAKLPNLADHVANERPASIDVRIGRFFKGLFGSDSAPEKPANFTPPTSVDEVKRKR